MSVDDSAGYRHIANQVPVGGEIEDRIRVSSVNEGFNGANLAPDATKARTRGCRARACPAHFTHAASGAGSRSRPVERGAWNDAGATDGSETVTRCQGDTWLLHPRVPVSRGLRQHHPE